MAVRINSDFAKEQKSWIKRALKGRPVYFGLQAQGAKKGKLVLSKKKGDVKPEKVKSLKIYEGDGKDQAKAKEKNEIQAVPAMGVCQGKEGGTLELMFERGSNPSVAAQFVKYFVTREVKCKSVRKVSVSEVDVLPGVPDKDEGDGAPVTAKSIESRAKALEARSTEAGGDKLGIPERIRQAAAQAARKPDDADEELDEIEFAIGTLERAQEFQEQLKATANEKGVAKEGVTAITKRVAEVLKQIQGKDFDAADEGLDAAEQSLINLRKGANLAPLGGPQTRSTSGQKDEKFFSDWLEKVKPDLKTLKDSGAGEFREISEHVKTIAGAAAKQDWPKATEAHRRAEPILFRALKAVEVGKAQEQLKSVDPNKLNEWKNNEYFAQSESLGARQALRNLSRSPEGRQISDNVVNLLNDGIRLDLNGPKAQQVLKDPQKKEAFDRMLGGFARGISMDEMISNRGNLVTALDAMYGEPEGIISKDQMFDEEIIKRRKDIKEQFFLLKPKDSKDELETYGRGRKLWTEAVEGQRMRQILQGLKKENPKVNLVTAVTDPDDPTRKKFWKLAGFSDEEVGKLDQKKFLEGLLALAKADPKLEKPTLLESLGLSLDQGTRHVKGLFGKGFGLSDDPTEYFVEKVRHGKNANVRLPESLASTIFEHLKVPMVGGVSGTTVDFIGLLQSKIDKDEGKRPEKEQLKNQKGREAVVAAFMFSMVGAGHHSLVEMIAGAQQWGYFMDVPNPFSEIAQAATAKQSLDDLKKEGKGKGPQAPSFLENGKTVRVTSYAGCLKAFEKYVRGLGVDTDGLLEWALDRVVLEDETFDVQTKKF